MRAIAALLLSLAVTPAPAASIISSIGPDQPPAGRSAFSEVFAEGVPFPFTALLDRLDDLGEVQTALIPLGRSLQRFSAHPDYFASPRLVVAVTADDAGPEAPHLTNRLYLGYQPAGDTIEAISYNEVAGRFEFEEVVGYAADAPRRIEPATRAICAACHQGMGPIFARPLWSETNANPAVAERLASLGGSFHGAPVRQTIDALEAFDAATDAAARFPLANRLWSEGCADPSCRAALLLAALRFGFSGAGPTSEGKEAQAFADRARALWPEGLETPGFDLPNRDPIHLLARMTPAEIVETTGAINPETTRQHVVLWHPDADAFASAAREIAAMLSQEDLAAVDALILRNRRLRIYNYLADCSHSTARGPEGGEEFRFTCLNENGPGAYVASGHYPPDGGPGRIDRVQIKSQAPLTGVSVIASRDTERDAMDLDPIPFEPSVRLANGFRVIGITFFDGGATGQFRVSTDFGPFADAVNRAASDEPAFGDGPFRRRAVIAALTRISESAYE